MIPHIRSLLELMAITEARETQKYSYQNDERNITSLDSGQRKRYIRSQKNKDVKLPNFPKAIIRKWIQNKEYMSRFIDNLDYNNQIQSSYDLTLIGRQYNRNQKDVA
tara:strand:+ start:1260 stop:1580 length:321 start_codon:yes stop_codon:yes gene_type:complete